MKRVKGLSQSQLARAVSVPVGSLRNWEQGRRAPRLDAAARLAASLGVSLDALVGATPAEMGKPENARATRPGRQKRARRKGGA